MFQHKKGEKEIEKTVLWSVDGWMERGRKEGGMKREEGMKSEREGGIQGGEGREKQEGRKGESMFTV